MDNSAQFRNETVNDRLKRTLERNRPKPLSKKSIDLSGGEASDLANATFDLPEVMRAKRLANREVAHQAKERAQERVKRVMRVYEGEMVPEIEEEDEEIDEPVIRKPQKKAPAKINYIKKEKKKTNSFSFSMGEETKLSKGMIYLGWAFCLFLTLRLFFAGGGIVDNIKKFSVLSAKQTELSEVHEENINLSKEIEQIEKNAAYQRKIVRDNLGFIASDEYLVLFGETKKAKSI